MALLPLQFNGADIGADVPRGRVGAKSGHKPPYSITLSAMARSPGGPIAGIVRRPLVMLVNPLVPAKTGPEFIAYAKGNPGKINMASPGIGTVPHLAGEMFKTMTGIDMVHVPYRGGGPTITRRRRGGARARSDPAARWPGGAGDLPPALR